MAILQDVEIHFAKVDPKRPNAKYNKKNPTWECQIRTESREKRKEWLALGLPVKDVIPDEEGMKPYYRVNLRKKSIKEKDGEPASPVDVIDGKKNPVDPNSIGNGSRGNIRIFQYEYTKDKENGGGKGTASVLMGIQLTKHVVYVPKPRDDDFGETETETVAPENVVDPDNPETGEDKSIY